jgi:LemA protein
MSGVGIGIIVGVVVLLIIILFSKYNKMIKLQNSIKQSRSGIDVYLNERFELIPNLVECVKGYVKHENEILENVAQLRKEYMEGNKSIKNAEKINDSMNRILALAENYPDLKASEQFLNLQKNLSKMESQLQAARRIYNNDVTQFNTAIKTVPNNIIAGLFGFKEEELFQIEEYKKENIKIDFEG